MLCVGCGLAKEDGAGGVLDVVAGPGDGLTVGLHGQLLKVSREAVQVLVESRAGQHLTHFGKEICLRGDEMSLSTEEVGVPHTQETTEYRDVLLERSLPEMLVHGMTTSEELVEIVVSNVKSNRKADGGPHTVATTDPVGETEHVLLVNAEFGHFRLVGGQGNKVLGNGRVILCGLHEPVLRGVRIGDSLCGSKCLGRNEEKSSLRVRVLQGFGHVGTVDVGDEVELHVGLAIWLEGLSDHDRTAVYYQRPFIFVSVLGRTYRSDPPMPMLTTVLMVFPV